MNQPQFRQSAWALEIIGLRKSFDRPAVAGLDLTVRTGEFYALVGPNGAGKTTTLKMVVGLLRPDSGSISVLGIDALADPVAAKQIIAWISDEPMVYDKLTPFEYLEFIAGLWGIDAGVAEARARELLAWLGLADHAHVRCEGFSKGMRQKVALAGALVHDPRVLVLDEPLTGLDAASARQVKTVLRERLGADKVSLVVITGSLLGIWSLMLSHALENVTHAFYARSDLDLILTSPVAAPKIFAVRMIIVALSTVLMATLLASPFINLLAGRGGARWLGAYAVVVAFGFAAIAI